MPLAYGGISDRIRNKLETMIQQEVDKPKPKNNLPPVGTELIRRYKGVDYHVVITHDGFEFDGQKYRSLSKIATVITGTKWNGLVFFGIKK